MGEVSHQFLLPDLSGERHPLRFITYAGKTDSRKSWVTYFAAELKLYFLLLEIRNMIQEQKASILSPPSPKKEKNGSLSQNSRFTLHFIVSIPRVNQNSVTRRKGLRDTGASRNGFIHARGTVTGDNHQKRAARRRWKAWQENR